MKSLVVLDPEKLTAQEVVDLQRKGFDVGDVRVLNPLLFAELQRKAIGHVLSPEVWSQHGQI